MIIQMETQDVFEPFYEYRDSQLLKLEIEQSNIPNRGMGLFATKDFQYHQIISEGYGTISRSENSQDRQFWYQKTMFLLDSRYCVNIRNPCSIIKDIIKWEPEKYKTTQYDEYRQREQFPIHEGHQRNAQGLVYTKHKTFFIANKKILAGQQIHVEYCFKYWRYMYDLFEQSKTKPL